MDTFGIATRTFTRSSLRLLGEETLVDFRRQILVNRSATEYKAYLEDSTESRKGQPKLVAVQYT